MSTVLTNCWQIHQKPKFQFCLFCISVKWQNFHVRKLLLGQHCSHSRFLTQPRAIVKILLYKLPDSSRQSLDDKLTRWLPVYIQEEKNSHQELTFHGSRGLWLLLSSIRKGLLTGTSNRRNLGCREVTEAAQFEESSCNSKTRAPTTMTCNSLPLSQLTDFL